MEGLWLSVTKAFPLLCESVAGFSLKIEFTQKEVQKNIHGVCNHHKYLIQNVSSVPQRSSVHTHNL